MKNKVKRYNVVVLAQGVQHSFQVTDTLKGCLDFIDHCFINYKILTLRANQ